MTSDRKHPISGQQLRAIPQCTSHGVVEGVAQRIYLYFTKKGYVR